MFKPQLKTCTNHQAFVTSGVVGTGNAVGEVCDEVLGAPAPWVAPVGRRLSDGTPGHARVDAPTAGEIGQAGRAGLEGGANATVGRFQEFCANHLKRP